MVLLASKSPDVVARCSQGLQGTSMMLVAADFGTLKQMLVHVKPLVLFLDFQLPELGGPNGIAAFLRQHRHLRIVVLSDPLPADMELGLFKAGARGCCRRDMDAAQVATVFMAMQQGELWIRRTLMLRLVDELSIQSQADAQPKRADAGGMVELTHREQEIAMLIGDGNSNKQIARRLDITERTVKAHLTGIFRKLGINDRLMLALRVMGSTQAAGAT
jgi:two-component system nitrate/nitrite response regulator NarL